MFGSDEDHEAILGKCLGREGTASAKAKRKGPQIFSLLLEQQMTRSEGKQIVKGLGGQQQDAGLTL